MFAHGRALACPRPPGHTGSGLLFLLLLPALAPAQTLLSWDAGHASDNWSQKNNWNPNNTPDGTGEVAVFATDGTDTTSVDMDMAFSIGGLRYENSLTDVMTIYNTNALTLGSYGIVSNSSTTQILGSPLALSANQSWSSTASGSGLSFTNTVNLASYALTLTPSTGSTLAFSGAINGTGSLTLNGTGLVTLSGANTYTGATTLTSGTLQLGSASAFTGNSALTLNGGTFALNGYDATVASLSGTGGTLSLGSNTLTAAGSGSTSFTGTLTGTGALTKTGTGSLTLSSSNAYTGTTNVNAGTLTLAHADALGTTAGGTNVASGATLALTNNIALGTEALALNGGTLANTSGTNSYAGVASGTGGVAVNGGSLTLSGTNTYSGTTTVANGATLTAQSNAALGSTAGATTVASGGTLALTNDLSIAENLNLAGTGNGGSGALNSTGTNTVSGTLTLSGATDLQVDSGTLTLSGGTDLQVDSGTLTLSGGISATNQNLTLDGTGDFAISGAIATGSGTLTQAGTGTTTLSGANTYTGATAINNGTVVAAHDTALGSAAGGTTVASGATLALSGGINLTGEALTLSGTGSGSGALTNADGSNTFTGAITLNSATTIGATAGDLTLSGGIAATNQDLTITGAGDTQISGAIATGTGALTKDGSGTLTLSGTNLYTGTTTINDGTLTLGASDRIIATGDLAIGATGTFNLNTYSQQIGDLTALADGAAVDFGTTGNANLLLFDNYTAPASGVLVINNWEEGTDQLATTVNSQNVSTIYLSGYGIAEIDNQTSTLLGLYGSAYLLQAIATDTIEWDGGGINNRWTTNTNWNPTGAPNSTDVALFDALGLGKTTVDLNSSVDIAGLTFGSGATSSYTLSSATNNLGLVGSLPYIQQQSDSDQYLAFNELQLGNNTVADLTGAGTLYISADITDGGSGYSLTTSGTGTLALSGTNTYTGATTITGGSTLRLDAADVLSDSTAVTVQSPSTFDLNGNADTVGSIAGDGAITLGGATLTAGGDNTSTTFSGVISETGNLVKAGSGVLTLSGANTYTGTTTISAGTLTAGHATALGTTAAGTTVSSGATLAFSGNIAIGSEAVSVAGTGDGGNGALRNLSGTNSLAGAVTVTDATTITSDAGSLTLSGGITGTNQNLTFDGAGAVTVSGAITTGTGNLTQAGSGTLTLSGTNTYSGTTTVSAGTLQLGASHTLSDSSAVSVASGATFDVNDYSDTVGSLAGSGNVTLGSGTLTAGSDNSSTSFSGVISETGNFAKSGTGTLTLSGDNTYSGTTTVSAGTLALAHSNALGSVAGGTTVDSGATLALTNNITVGNEAIALSGTLANTSGSNSLAGNLSGTGAVNVSSGTLTLSGSNTYSGATTLGTGTTLTVGAAGAIGDSSAVSVGSGATFDLNDLSETVGSLAGSGNVTLGTGTLTAGGDNSSTSFSGVISESGALTKTGSGTLTLSGANTYTGATTVSSGTLALGADDRLTATTDVNIGATGTFSLNTHSQQIGDLTALADGAAVDFGTTGSANLLLFDTYTAPGSGVMVINNWEQGTDQLASTIGSQDVSTIFLSGYGLAGMESTTSTLLGGYGSGYLLYVAALPTVEWDGGGNNNLWFNNSNWNPNGDPNSTDVAVFDALGLSQTTVDVSADATIAGITFGSGATSSYTLSSATNNIALVGTLPAIMQQSDVDQYIAVNELQLGNNTVADVTGAGDLVISAAITDGGSGYGLTTSGTGTVVLSGNNTYTGATAVTGTSTLQLGAANVLSDSTDVSVESGGSFDLANYNETVGSIAGEGTISLGSATLTAGANDSSTTFSGVLSGTGSLTKTGSGTLTLGGTATNTTTGTTTIAEGTLALAQSSGNAISGNITLGDGSGTDILRLDASDQIADTSALTFTSSGQFDLNGNNETVGSISAASSSASIALGSGTLTTGTTGSTFAGVISGSGNLVTNGSDTLTLSGANTFSGNLTVGSGTTLIATHDDALGSGGGNTTVASAGTLELQGGITADTEDNIYLAGTGTTGQGAVLSSSGNNTLDGTFTLTGDATISATTGTLTVGTQANSPAFYLAGNDLTLNTDGGNITFEADFTNAGDVYKTGSGTLLLNHSEAYPAILDPSTTFYLQDGTTILNTYNNENVGMRGDVVIGDGVGAAGSAILQQGTDPAGVGLSNNLIADSSNITINADGHWDLQGFKETVNSLTLDGGSVDATGGDRLDVVDYIHSTSTTQTATITGQLGLAGDAAKDITVAAGSILDIAAVVSSGGIEKNGDGQLLLSSYNSYEKITHVTDGVLTIEHDHALGQSFNSSTTSINGVTVYEDSTVVDSGAQLQLNGVAVAGEELLLYGTGQNNDGTGALQTLAGTTNAWSGAVTLGANSEIQTSAGASLTISGNVTGSGKTLTLDSIGNTTFSGNNTLNTLNKTGAGTLTVTGTNTYATANINEGTYAVGASNILANTMDVNLGSSGTFNVGTYTDVIDDLTGSGTLTIASGGDLTIDQIGGSLTSGTPSGAFTGTLDVDGILTLNGGTIGAADGTGSTGTIELTANNTLNIAGNFTFGGTLELADNTTLNLVGSGTTFNVDTLRVTGDSVIDFAGTDFATLNIGTLEIDMGGTIYATNWNSFYDLWTATNFTGATLDASNSTTAQITFAGFTPSDTIWLTYDYGANEITVPEPSTYGALLMGTALAGYFWRRRKRRVGFSRP